MWESPTPSSLQVRVALPVEGAYEPHVEPVVLVRLSTLVAVPLAELAVPDLSRLLLRAVLLFVVVIVVIVVFCVLRSGRVRIHDEDVWVLRSFVVSWLWKHFVLESAGLLAGCWSYFESLSGPEQTNKLPVYIDLSLASR